MVDAIDLDFLDTPTAIENGTGKVHEMMPQTIEAMNRILAIFSELSWDVLTKTYVQWYELNEAQALDGTIPMFDRFREVTKSLLNLPICTTNTEEFIHMVIWIEGFKKLHVGSSIIAEFAKLLPNISQEDINTARDTWIQHLKDTAIDIASSEIGIVFMERDNEGYYTDLSHLRFFHEQADYDDEVEGLYERFGDYTMPIPSFC